MSARTQQIEVAALDRYPMANGSTLLVTTKEIATAAVSAGLNVQARLGFAAGAAWADKNHEVSA